MIRRVVARGCSLAAAIMLAIVGTADAEYRGTDLWGNVAPGLDGLAGRYPASHYALDYHVNGLDVGLTGVHTNDSASEVAQFLLGGAFMISTWFVRLVMTIFSWAMNLDLINGKHGLLNPIGASAQHLYADTVVPLTTTAFLLLGGWIASKMVSRRFNEVGSGMIRSLCMSVAVLAIIFNPADTIGRAYSIVNQASIAVVSSTTGGGRVGVLDQIFKVLIYQPWVVLEFGGFQVCTGSHVDKDGFPTAVHPDDSGPKTCHSTIKQGPDGHGGYAQRFLKQIPDSKERDAEYDALNKGRAPSDPQFDGYKVDRTDSPAVDMMQADGTMQRAGLTALIIVGQVGGILLLGLLCFAALFAQLAIMCLLIVAPIALLFAIIPPLHGVFLGWAKALGKVMIAGLAYAVMLGAVMGVSVGLMSFATDPTTFIIAFGAQGALFLGAFMLRGKIFARVAPGARKHEYYRREENAKTFVMGAATGAAAMVGTTATSVVKRGFGAGRQESAPNPDAKRGGADAQTQTVRPGVDSSSPPASAGREYSPPGPPDAREPSTAVATMGGRMPTRAFADDLQAARQPRSEPPSQPVPRQPVAPSGRPAAREDLREAFARERLRQQPVAAPDS